MNTPAFVRRSALRLERMERATRSLGDIPLSLTALVCVGLLGLGVLVGWVIA